MDIRQIKAIDTHSHLNHGAICEPANTEAHLRDLDYLIRMNQSANIDISMYSTFSAVSCTESILDENAYLFELAQEYDWFYQWVVVDPRNPLTFQQAASILNRGKCVGIKIHPGYHKYCPEEYADKLSAFASDHGAILLTHNMTTPQSVIPFADIYPDVTYILAHVSSGDYAEAINGAKHRNVYTDTSSSSSSLNHIIEHTVQQAGSDRILFGTDTYAAGFQRGRIEYALISGEDKVNILRNNALRLFGRFF